VRKWQTVQAAGAACEKARWPRICLYVLWMCSQGARAAPLTIHPPPPKKQRKRPLHVKTPKLKCKRKYEKRDKIKTRKPYYRRQKHSNISGGLRKTHLFFSRSSKVIDFGTNRKRVCDFLLVRHSNLGSILHRFRDIAGYLSWPQRYSTRILGVFPLGQISDVGSARAKT